MSVFNSKTNDYPNQVLWKVGEKLCMKEDMADVHFVFNSSDESSERIPAHKLILMAASDVFVTMFNGSWKENKEVKIVDVSAGAFKEFLQFFYHKTVKLTMENVGKVMNLGKMCEMTDCVAVCGKFLKNNLNDDNVCSTYGLAILLDQEDLKRSCETIIGLHTNAVFNTPGFLTCSEEVMAQILRLSWLQCTEYELFAACMSWLKAICKQDNLTKEMVEDKLGESFYQLRFGLILLQDIPELISTYFPRSEYTDILNMITNKELTPNQLSGKCIKLEKRDSLPWNDQNLITFYRLISKSKSKKPYYIKNEEITKFSSNEPLLLKSFKLNTVRKYYYPIYYDMYENIPTEISIVELADTKDATTETLLYDGNADLPTAAASHKMVLLSKLVFIRPGFVYGIRLKQNPPEKSAIGHLLRSECQSSDGKIIRFYDDPFLTNDVVPTNLICDLRFYPIGK